MTLTPSEAGRVAAVLAGQAAVADDPQAYLRDVVGRAELPGAMRVQVAGKRYGDLGVGTRELVRWADAKGVNPADPQRTVLGSLLVPVLDEVGPDVAAELVAVIVARKLFRSTVLREELLARFQVPQALDALGDGFGVPDLDGPDPGPPAEQQGAPRATELLDVGGLARAIRCSAAVCRVEDASGTALGSGFLIGDDLALTSRHVVATTAPEDVRLRFRCTGDAAGSVHGLDPAEPVARCSPVDELDFAALRLARPVGPDDGLEPLDPVPAPLPVRGDTLAILQHPGGGPMKLALTANGVVQVRPDTHTVRYVTTTAGGSSGSPCFDEDWRLVALHRAERATLFGAVREGVLIADVLDRLHDLL